MDRLNKAHLYFEKFLFVIIYVAISQRKMHYHKVHLAIYAHQQ